MIGNLIYLCSVSENVYLKEQLEEIKQIIITTPNDLELGQKIRKLL